jgi:hypothetical protein
MKDKQFARETSGCSRRNCRVHFESKFELKRFTGFHMDDTSGCAISFSSLAVPRLAITPPEFLCGVSLLDG